MGRLISKKPRKRKGSSVAEGILVAREQGRLHYSVTFFTFLFSQAKAALVLAWLGMERGSPCSVARDQTIQETGKKLDVPKAKDCGLSAWGKRF